MKTFLLLVTLLCVSCKSSPTVEDPVIILDDWWSYDYAKNACQLQHLFCVDDARVDVAAFENKFITAFGTNPECHGLRIVRFGGPLAKPEGVKFASENHWSLSFSIVPDDRAAQSWLLLDKNNKHYAERQGAPDAAAQKVCAFIKGKGGSTE